MKDAAVDRWSKDISEMESFTAEIVKNAVQRWKDRVKAMKLSYATFSAEFEEEREKLRTAFGNFSKDFNNEVEAINQDAERFFNHIWGSPEKKEAWQKKYGR